MRLINFDGSRSNNFTLIRIVMAWLVLYGHAYAIQKVPGIRDPLNMIFQGSIWIGAISVNGFFAISGYLVTASIVRRSLLEYVISRVIRIYPALIVCVLSSVFIVGPIMTNLGFVEYFSDFKTYKYLSNCFAFFTIQSVLPGVFESNVRPAINGSLWTLTVEVRCYILLAIAGSIGLFKKRIAANIFIVLLFLFSLFFFQYLPLLGEHPKWSRPGLYFLIGVAFYINRSAIILDGRIAIFSLILVLTSFGKAWFPYVFPVSFVYLIFYLAYATKYVPIDESLGDISYGVYIYAWPIQQIVSMLTPNGNPYTNAIFSTFIVFILAYFSWRKVELPMLNKKDGLLSISRLYFNKIVSKVIRN